MTIDNTISFRADMIDLILSGRKTVTIRPMQPQPTHHYVSSAASGAMYWQWNGVDVRDNLDWLLGQCPHGKVGDVAVIRQKPDIRLKLTKVTTERLPCIIDYVWRQDGVPRWPREHKARHWNSFYGDTEYRWEKNPWVWAIQFELVEGRKSEMTIDQTQEIAHD